MTMKDDILAEIAALESAHGPEDVRVGEAKMRLGIWIAENRLYSDGEPHFAEGLAIVETALGPDASVAEALDRWAGIAGTKKDVRVAEPYRLMGIAVKETVFGPDSAEVETAIDRLLGDYRDQLRIAEAVPLTERALGIAERRHGPASAQAARKLEELAGLLAVQERYEEAEPLHLRALAIRGEIGPADGREMMDVLGALAWTRLGAGRFEEAREPLRRSLAIRRVLQADEPESWIQGLEFVLRLYRDAGRLVEGVDEVVAGMDMAGSWRPEVAVMLLNLAELLADDGQAAEAARIGRMCMAVTARVLAAGDVEALRELPSERRKLGFLERLRRVADPDLLHRPYPAWAPEDPIAASFWNKERGDRGGED